MISPIGIVASLLMRDRSVFCVSLIFSFGIVGSILHRIVGQIIFPAQLIAKRSWGCTMRLLVNAGLEEVLVGANGIHELEFHSPNSLPGAHHSPHEQKLSPMSKVTRRVWVGG